MADSYLKYVASSMRSYYKDFSKYAKGRAPECKVAWVTSFTPVEILDCLGIEYIYPESYAAVIAASGKEQALLEESDRQGLSLNCCSYSCCFEGCLATESGPRGLPPKPDVLIATNNQCNTLPGWWNTLAKKYNVPLIILDYPGEFTSPEIAASYVKEQHQEFISRMEELSGNKLDMDDLKAAIGRSKASVEAWKRVISCFKDKDIPPTLLFDNINFLITARCKEDTATIYNLMADELAQSPDKDPSLTPLFWIGYPLWYHPDRYLSEVTEGFAIVGSNYNRISARANVNAKDLSGGKCAISCRNKSCKCDFVSAKDVGIVQTELEIDMIDREFLDLDRAKSLVAVMKESLN